MFTVMDNLLVEPKCSIRCIISVATTVGLLLPNTRCLWSLLLSPLLSGAQAFRGDVAILFIYVGSALTNMTLPTV